MQQFNRFELKFFVILRSCLFTSVPGVQIFMFWTARTDLIIVFALISISNVDFYPMKIENLTWLNRAQGIPIL